VALGSLLSAVMEGGPQPESETIQQMFTALIRYRDVGNKLKVLEVRDSGAMAVDFVRSKNGLLPGVGLGAYPDQALA
jgi:hypothetical protein